MCTYKKCAQKKILYRIWRNKDTKQNLCAGKGNAHINKRHLNHNYCTIKTMILNIILIYVSPAYYTTIPKLLILLPKVLTLILFAGSSKEKGRKKIANK